MSCLINVWLPLLPRSSEFTKYNESPFFLLMQPTPDPDAKQLPVTLCVPSLSSLPSLPSLPCGQTAFALQSTA